MTAGTLRTSKILCQVILYAAATCLLSCGQPENSADTVAVLHRGISGEPSTLDPAAVADSFSHEVIADLYEGLTAESPAGETLPGVASAWDVDASGTLYTFHLRTDARWSNGEPVTADHFVAAWRRVVDPKTGSPLADLLRVVAGASAIIGGQAPASTLGVNALSATELQVRLEQPAPYLPGLLAHPAAFPIFSEAAARSHDPAHWVSNGAYVLAGWQPGTKLSLTRNSHYWDKDHVRITQVEYSFSPDDASQFRRYTAGELDLTDKVPANAVPRLRLERPHELRIAPFLATAYYGLNLGAAPLASNLKLRQALAMAIDRRRVCASLGFGQSGAYGFVPPGTWNYSPQSWEWRDLGDPERIARAQSLYAQAGYSTAKPMRMRLLYNTNPAIRDTALVLASMWHEVLGVESELIDEEYRVFLESRHERSRWDVARLSWSADYNDAGNFLDTLRTTSPNNDEFYRNPAYDALLDDAAHITDPQERRSRLEAGERMMLADYPIVPLYYFVSERLVKPYVSGVQSNPLNRIPSKSLSLSPH